MNRKLKIFVLRNQFKCLIFLGGGTGGDSGGGIKGRDKNKLLLEYEDAKKADLHCRMFCTVRQNKIDRILRSKEKKCKREIKKRC